MINSFRNEHRFLSNFYPCEIYYEGLYYPSVENAFQAAKTSDIKEKEAMTRMTAAESKKAGREVQRIPEFENTKFYIMEVLLRIKFRHPDLLTKLKATTGELIEGNTWHDNIWGMCVCEKCANKEKQNWLGRLLMKIRDE